MFILQHTQNSAVSHTISHIDVFLKYSRCIFILKINFIITYSSAPTEYLYGTLPVTESLSLEGVIPLSARKCIKYVPVIFKPCDLLPVD